MGVLGEVEGVIRATQGTLEIAQEDIDRAELGQFDAGFLAAGDDALVLSADELHGAKAPQAVGDNCGRRRDAVSGEGPYFLDGERLLAQAYELRCRRAWLHRGDERHLVLRTSPALPPERRRQVESSITPAVELATVPRTRMTSMSCA
jgi:hypothetical protein